MRMQISHQNRYNEERDGEVVGAENIDRISKFKLNPYYGEAVGDALIASNLLDDLSYVYFKDSLVVWHKRESQKNMKASAAMTKKGAYAATSYMASAVLLIMFNKAVLSSYKFQSANVITSSFSDGNFLCIAVVFVANICTAIYLASISYIGKSSGLSTFGLMWCNGILCAPVLLLWTSIRGDLTAMLDFPDLFTPGFQCYGILNKLLCILEYNLNSALVQTICGNLKDLLTIGLGWLLFGGLPFDYLNVAGQSLGFLGSCLYAYCKLRGI